MDIDSTFRDELGDALKRCLKMRGKDRSQVARELAERLGRLENPVKRVVTESMLNEFTRSIQSGREAHFPAAWLRCLCEIIGDDELARLALPEHLRAALSIGERVLESEAGLRLAVEEIAKYSQGKPRGRGK